ncbi:MAG: hypothetical protein IJP68_07230 [Selenomonadaceae bacterium]|nr:hypothetical protein [Selenomonadaceae bacterium]MBR0061259.1 hypothetical protein [Selenomonadaceae bacterium]
MATTNSAVLTLEYDDASTRNITFNDVSTSALANIKDRAMSLNTTLADSIQGAAYHETFISDTGAPITRIKAAKYVVTEESVIYNG